LRTEEVGPERDFELVPTNPAAISKHARMPAYTQKQTGHDQHSQNKEPDKAPGRKDDSDPHHGKSSKGSQID